MSMPKPYWKRREENAGLARSPGGDRVVDVPGIRMDDARSGDKPGMQKFGSDLGLRMKAIPVLANTTKGP
jgi:hypothetical protein